ncbi:MAG: exodeoxyribonuclease VII large subunit [Bacteroidales bacterium]|nr:exodeoxyribonuclease VII large subunit [Bacteroidales bacterium]
MSVKPVSLLELNRAVKQLLKEHSEPFYWIIAEISELKVNYSGHCYLELIQKDESSDQIVARSRATIWASNFRMIKAYFESTTGQELSEGLNIMVKVGVEFHEVFGLSLNITDIEPTYTVGEIALRKQKIIEKLTAEGVLEMNKEVEMPLLCNKIAVISSKTAAGYEDFVNQIENNSFGFKFYTCLFSAVMQGEAAEGSIIKALDRVYQHEEIFDAVVIIRGGGSQFDLSCFNNYWLAYNITQFPLPVITGIGHEQDDTVADLVAHTRLKTPTAVAAFLIENLAELDREIQYAAESIFQNSVSFIREQKDKILDIAFRIQTYMKDILTNNKGTLLNTIHNLISKARKLVFKKHICFAKIYSALNYLPKNYFATRNLKLDHYNEYIAALNPESILKKGYSITYKNRKVIKSENEVESGDTIETVLFKGKIRSIIK